MDGGRRGAMHHRSVAALLAGTGVFAVLGLVFGVLVRPVDQPGCTDGLYPGTYRDLFAPVFVAAYLGMAGLVAWVRPPGRLARAGLALSAAVVALAPLWDGPLAIAGVLGLIACVPAGLVCVILLLVRRDDRTAYAVLWLAFAILLPGAFMGAYIDGAGIFCF